MLSHSGTYRQCSRCGAAGLVQVSFLDVGRPPVQMGAGLR